MCYLKNNNNKVTAQVTVATPKMYYVPLTSNPEMFYSTYITAIYQ